MQGHDEQNRTGSPEERPSLAAERIELGCEGETILRVVSELLACTEA